MTYHYRNDPKCVKYDSADSGLRRFLRILHPSAPSVTEKCFQCAWDEIDEKAAAIRERIEERRAEIARTMPTKRTPVPYIHVQECEPPRRSWCETCWSTSRYEFDLYALREDGPEHMGTGHICERCSEQANERAGGDS